MLILITLSRLVYNSLPVRHWDTWTPTDGQRKQLFFIRLTRNPDSLISEDSDGFEHVERPHAQEDEGAVPAGRWTALMDKEQAVDEASKDSNKTERVMVKSPLAGTKLECPVGPFGGASDFSVSSTHLVFHAKDPHVNPMWHTRTQVYLLPLSPRFASDAVPRALTVGTQGACANPVFSKDGKRIAWLEMREDGYEADRHRVMIYEVESGKRWGVSEKWDRSPSAVEWCPCGEKVYLVAEVSCALWQLLFASTALTCLFISHRTAATPNSSNLPCPFHRQTTSNQATARQNLKLSRTTAPLPA